MTADTLLVGHGLENDLRALKLLHGRWVPHAFASSITAKRRSLFNNEDTCLLGCCPFKLMCASVCVCVCVCVCFLTGF